ncbi:hypothetical protein EMCRGX_G024288 [Ephydatia muelleri]
MAAFCAQRNIPNDSNSYMKHVLCPEDGDDLYTFIKSATPHWKNIARALKMTHVQTKDIISTSGLTQQSDYQSAAIDPVTITANRTRSFRSLSRTIADRLRSIRSKLTVTGKI